MPATLGGHPGAEFNGGFAAMDSVASSEMNSACISEIIDGLSLQVRGHVRSAELSSLCLSLSRQIDFAMANNEVPNRALELPSLLKKVCVWKTDTLMQAIIMVLMISIKNACRTGWFSDRDSDELSDLAKESASNFCRMPHFNTEPSCSNLVITSIMSRFYPRMKMGHLFFHIEVKPGFNAYLGDFQISENLKSAPEEKIRLFVGQMDNIETSACLVSPSKVNFLVNGHGVERRSNLYMDTGPQNPTVLTHLLTYGLNVLQAVGEFSGNYLIAVACMSEVPEPDSNSLLDYEHIPPVVDSDSEIIEGASQIPLSCPIRRIRTPVKGHLCKHIQCFDFDNYVGINSRRPSWRCPSCNQHVCFTDLRIDQKMVKILKEVGTNVINVIFASDGSWIADMETDDNAHTSEDRTSNSGQNESPQTASIGLLNVPVDILDLTQNDSMGVTPNETEDQKFSAMALQSRSLAQTIVVDPDRTNTNDVNQSNLHSEDDSGLRIFMSTFGQGLPDFTSNTRNLGAYASTSNHIAAPAGLPEIPIGAPNRVYAFAGNALASTSLPQTETSLLNTSQYHFGNPTITNEYGRFPSVPRQVSGTPIAVQAPPHITAPVLQQTSTNSVNTFMQNGFSAAYQAYPAPPTNTNSTISSNLIHLPPSSSNQYPVIQNYWQQNSSRASARLIRWNVTQHAPNQVPNAYQGTDELQISSQQMVNLRMPQASSQSHGRNQSPVLPSGIHFFRPPAHIGGLQDRIGHTNVLMNSQRAHLVAAANRAADMALNPSRTFAAPTFSMNSGTGSTPLIRDDVTNPANQNKRPAGRMRGALSGQALTDALNEYIIRPSQQAARHISDVNSLLNNPPPGTTIFHG
ncbi:E4 SUMO-protein ligase PIAL2-like isoform X2 [Primulina huaijiensis]|uniref:E4 SUMO-protein ligase PIAL2-like isoform X2 n=1 Tax=Primulina huaijiensis TaxID=1492673 RepID=UPI003CC75D3F